MGGRRWDFHLGSAGGCDRWWAGAGSGSGREGLRARILWPCFHVPWSVIEERWVSRAGLARCNVGKATLFSGATRAGGTGPGAASKLGRERINVEEMRREMREEGGEMRDGGLGEMRERGWWGSWCLKLRVGVVVLLVLVLVLWWCCCLAVTWADTGSKHGMAWHGHVVVVTQMGYFCSPVGSSPQFPVQREPTLAAAASCQPEGLLRHRGSDWREPRPPPMDHAGSTSAQTNRSELHPTPLAPSPKSRNRSAAGELECAGFFGFFLLPMVLAGTVQLQASGYAPRYTLHATYLPARVAFAFAWVASCVHKHRLARHGSSRWSGKD